MSEFLTANWANQWAVCEGFARLNDSTGIVFDKRPEAIEGTEIHASVTRLADTGETDRWSTGFGEPFLRLLRKFPTWATEMALSLTWLGSGPGRTDGFAYDPLSRLLRVVELKTGFTPVLAEGNLQLLVYAIDLAKAYPCDRVELMVCQPRDYAEPEKTWVIDSGTLDSWREHICKRHAAAHIGETLTTGDHCRLCPGKFACPAFAAVSGYGVDISREYAVTTPAPASIGAELKVLAVAIARMKARKTSLEDLAEYRINRGVPIPGWEVGPTYGNRQWLDTVATEYVLRNMGVDATKETMITPAEAERQGATKDVVAQLCKPGKVGTKLIPVRKPKI